MKAGDACWIVRFGGTITRTLVSRVVEGDERSAGVIETLHGTFLPSQVFDHEPEAVREADEWGSYTVWK